MRAAKFISKVNVYFLIVYAVAALCFYQTVAAQSGRRHRKRDVVADVPKPPTASKPAADSPPAKPDAPIASIIIAGEIQHNYAFYRSNYLGSAIKECINELKARPQPLLTVVKGGSLNFTEAQAQAKKETDAYVLWLGFVVKDDGYGNEILDYIDYALLMPESGKRLTYGRVTPGETGIVAQGGVLRLPSRTKRPSAIVQIKAGAREVADTLMRGGWL